MFLGGCEQKSFLLKWHFWGKLQTRFVFGRRKERAFSLTLSVLGKCHVFCYNTKSPNTTKIGFQQAQGKTQNRSFGLKSAILGRALEKGFYLLSVIHKNCALLKHNFYSFSSKARLCRNKRVQVETKQTFTENLGLFTNTQKVFFVFFFHFVFVSFWGGERKPQKGSFPAILGLFPLFVTPKGMFSKSFSSSYSVIFPCFPCVFIFKSPSFSLLFVHQPLFGKHSWVFWGFRFLPFPLLMFDCLFETNFPNIPFFKPNLFSCLPIFSVVLFLFSWFMSMLFCFMLVLFGVCVSFVVLSCFCFVSSCFAFRL